MAVPWQARLLWTAAGLVERRPVMQQPAGRVPAARRRRQRMNRLPGARIVVGRPDARAEIGTGQIVLDDGTVLPIRTYRPRGGRDAALPVVVNFHGGGWVSGDAYQSEWWCAAVAARAGVLVVSVEYRLAPEHRFPVPAEDCYAATRWVAANAASLGADAARLAVMGDSAGGNLATVVALMARDRGGPAIALQVLIYPSVDARRGRYPSEAENAGGPGLSSKDVRNTPRVYLPDPERDANNPYASPVLADLAGLPPALIQTAEHDPLRDHGATYAKRLEAAGVPVRYTNYANAIHGYISTPGVVPESRAALAEAVEMIRETLRTSGMRAN
jgi:acetyl esterase